MKASYFSSSKGVFCALATAGIAAISSASIGFSQTEGQTNVSLPSYLAAIQKARIIEDTRVARPSAKSDIALAFEQAQKAGVGVRTDLEWLIENASPAGRIYAAVLLRLIDRQAGTRALERLKADKDILVYKNAGDKVHYSVGEVAIDLLSDKPSICLSQAPSEK